MLPAAIEAFSLEVAAELGLGVALALEDALEQIDTEADGCPAADSFIRAAEWIFSRRDRTVDERLAMLDKLRHHETPALINLAQFTGW